MDIRINAPPMVGVPALAKMLFGTVIAYRLPDLVGGQLANHDRPTTKEITNAVKVASTARNVM